jgi:hypothetical protein
VGVSNVRKAVSRQLQVRGTYAITGGTLRFGRSEVEIKNGLVIVMSEDETEERHVLAILQHYCWVREEVHDELSETRIESCIPTRG